MPESHGHDSSGKDPVRAICAGFGNRPDALIEILIDVQALKGCIPDDAAAVVAAALNLSRAEVHGVRSFYGDFSTAPKGRRIVKLCRAEACQAVGSDALAQEVERRLRLKTGQTAADGSATLEVVYCLGNCALGPAAMVNGRLIGRADPEKVLAALGAARHD